MKKVLLPTDFSDNAWNAIVYAIHSYKDIPCQFYILHVYDLNIVPLTTTVSSQKIGHIYEMTRIESEKGLKRTLEDIENSKVSELHSFQFISESGYVADVIKDVVQSKQIDLIVMGTKGMTGATTVFLGSTTQKTIRAVHECPVLVIPREYRFEKISEIGFATDFQRIYHNAEINPILDMAKKVDATIRMIHIYDKPTLNTVQNYNSNMLERYFKNVKYEFHVIENFSTVAKGIKAFIEELEIDVMAMINYKHSFIERLTREAVIKKMIFHTKIPLLIIPADT